MKNAWVLTPDEHAQWLHETGWGRVTIAHRVGRHWYETSVAIPEVPAAVRQLAGQADVYMTQNRFRGPRQIATLAELDTLFVDLDYHRVATWAEQAPGRVLDAALLTLEGLGLPLPTWAMATGRGLALLWQHGSVPRMALPRWNACQRLLYEGLRPFGADPRALDAARVLRVVGTTNSKTGTFVEAVMPVHPGWGFDPLAAAILPMARGALQDLRFQRGLRRAEKPAERTFLLPEGFNQATLWEARLTDLQTLLQLRWWGQLPPGERDTWLFLAAVAMSWLAPPIVLQRELVALAKAVGGWAERETRSRLQSVLRRATAAANGQTIEWKGRPVDPRYTFKTATILEWLQITADEQQQLRTLVGPEIMRVRHREAERDRKHRAGEVQQDRASYLAQWDERWAQAWQMREEMALPVAEVARQLGISSRQVRRYLKKGPPPTRDAGGDRSVRLYGGVAWSLGSEKN